MKYTEEMILESSSGYCMPFEEQNGKDVKMTLGYGKHKKTGSNDTFFHHGVDFNAKNYLLSAVTTGVASSIGNDKKQGIFQTIRYGKYEVTYSNLATIFANFGQRVRASDVVAMSGDKLHMEVKFNGDELNPLEFLTMLYGNIKAMEHSVNRGQVEFLSFEIGPTKYEKDKLEIEELMMRFFPFYMEDLQHEEYKLPKHTEQSLRNIFTVGSSKNYFFETMPCMANPMGLGGRAMPLAVKVQNILIADFLNYLALRHNVYLSTMDDSVKKLYDEATLNSGIIDPLADLDIDVQSFDIPRLVSVYPDRACVRWWAISFYGYR